jgi:RHS repeat-associated protein
MKKRYVHGPGIDEPLAMENGNVAYYYHADGLGSIVALSNASGRVAQAYEYDAFGRLHDRMNAVKQPYTFTGREWDRETGLYYYRARYYDPEIGRFTSKDPIGINGGDVNFYAYVGNNPVNYSDPYGLASLVYDSNTGTLTLYDIRGSQVGRYPAGNNTSVNSNGPWPAGRYDYLYYIPHPESATNGPFGSNGNFVFDVPGRSGMGVHSGRGGPQSPTNGCIRTTNEGTRDILNLNATDPLTDITVR